MDDASEQRWPPLFGPLALVAGLFLGLCGGIVVDLIANAGGANLNHPSPGVIDAQTVAQDLGFVIAAVYLAARIGSVSPRQFGLRMTRPWWRAIALVVAALGVFYLVSYAWFAVLHSTGAEKNLVRDLGGNGNTIEILAACAVTCVVAPICEELLFRGFVFRALRNWRGVWPAAAITGVLFGAVHGLSAPAVDLLPLAFLGFVLCIVYERSGSLYPCIALHVLNNAIAFGADEHWGVRIVELAAASLASVALVLILVQLVAPAGSPAAPRRL
ncbi:MAG TPA: CPBP family intramembrane glutamic endopeptidase [Solirubrobacteraceae bacterium]|nr:CPBP family intramembrane glutamic endopeptidase [Solirubrobacteraceae bacterium]